MLYTYFSCQYPLSYFGGMHNEVLDEHMYKYPYCFLPPITIHTFLEGLKVAGDDGEVDVRERLH